MQNPIVMLAVSALVGALLSGCGNSPQDAQSNESSAPTTADTDTVIPRDPCALLPLPVIRRAIPAAEQGKRDRKGDQYGVLTCEWRVDDRLALILQHWQGTGRDSVKDNLRDSIEGKLDPANSRAAGNIRFEILPGIGDEAIAVVENPDPAKGIVGKVAILDLRKATNVVEVLIPALANAERDTILAALTDFGKTIAERL